MHPFLANKKQKKCTPNTQPAKCTTFFPSVSAAKQIPQEISLYSPFCIKSPLSHSLSSGREGVLRKSPAESNPRKPRHEETPIPEALPQETANQNLALFRKQIIKAQAQIAVVKNGGTPNKNAISYPGYLSFLKGL